MLVCLACTNAHVPVVPRSAERAQYAEFKSEAGKRFLKQELPVQQMT
jgi:hypothetical protein